jgi:hypothetical protein
MAELRIQPKKSSPSPWLLVALALVVLAAAAYFFLRPDPAQEPVPATTPVATTSADSLATDTSAARATPPPADDSATTAPGSAAAGTARAKLLQLSDPLTQLTDRSDLREDAEQRDNFTSATSRLAEGDPQASLRPGMVAAANLLLAVQQRGYPNLETEANALTLQASQLSGRDATSAEQARNHAYFSQVSTLLNTMSYPARDVL